MAETISTSLPKCELLSLLAEKAMLRRDIDFDFLRELSDFRIHVNSEMSYIQLIFPEYTPHDEKHHLEHLFHLADKVLERKRLEKMNSAELFLLAVGIYGHDWGMSGTCSIGYKLLGFCEQICQSRHAEIIRINISNIFKKANF